MLEAQTIPSSSDFAVPAQPTAEWVDESWNRILDIVNVLAVPKGEPRRAALYAANASWVNRRNIERKDYSTEFAPVVGEELRSFAAALMAQVPVAAQLASEYPLKAVSNKTKQGGELPTEYVTGIPPWVWAGLVLAGGAAAVFFRRKRRL